MGNSPTYSFGKNYVALWSSLSCICCAFVLCFLCAFSENYVSTGTAFASGYYYRPFLLLALGDCASALIAEGLNLFDLVDSWEENSLRDIKFFTPFPPLQIALLFMPGLSLAFEQWEASPICAMMEAGR